MLHVWVRGSIRRLMWKGELENILMGRVGEDVTVVGFVGWLS